MTVSNGLKVRLSTILKYIRLDKYSNKKNAHAIKAKKGQWFRGFLVGFIISVIVFVLTILGHFKAFENPVTAMIQQIRVRQSSDIALLFITQDEYQQGFNGISPLSRERLAEIVQVLVKFKPRAIALDIDLSDKGPGYEKLESSFAIAKANDIPIIIPSVVKPRIKVEVQAEHAEKPKPYLPAEYEKNQDGFTLYDGPKALNIAQMGNPDIMHGGSIFTLDRDGIFRNGTAFYQKSNGNGIIPSFPLSIAAASRGITQNSLEECFATRTWNTILKEGSIEIKDDQSNNLVNIHYSEGGKFTPNFLGNYSFFPYDIDVSRLLKNYKGESETGTVTIFKDKVVIVGGVYDHNDFYKTPVGEMSGMEIIANMTQSILDHNMISHLNYFFAFLLEVLLGAVAAFLFVLLPPVWALAVCFLSLIPITVYLSLIVFNQTYYWIDFIPTIIGVVIHGVISKVEQKAIPGNN